MKLGVNSIGITGLAFNSEGEVSGKGWLAEMTDDIRGIAIREMHKGGGKYLFLRARDVWYHAPHPVLSGVHHAEFHLAIPVS